MALSVDQMDEWLDHYVGLFNWDPVYHPTSVDAVVDRVEREPNSEVEPDG